MARKPPKFEASSWEFTQRMIRIGHNRRVKRYFRDIESDSSVTTGRGAIKTSLLIRDADSAIESLNKMLYFSNYLERDFIATTPDGWQVKKGQNIPQLAIVFRNADKDSISGDYPMHIPHYNGNKKPKIPSYYKGDHWARWILKDNSQIVVNAKTEAEALRVIRRLEKYVDRKFQTPETPWLVTGKTATGTYKKFKAVPIRADYYPQGKENSFPQWREYL